MLSFEPYVPGPHPYLELGPDVVAKFPYYTRDNGSRSVVNEPRPRLSEHGTGIQSAEVDVLEDSFAKAERPC